MIVSKEGGEDMTKESFLDSCKTNKDSYELLAAAVLWQAIVDYKELKIKGKTIIQPKYGASFSLNEITFFFNHEWSEILLALAGLNIDGKYIIKKLKENNPKSRKIASYKDGCMVEQYTTIGQAAKETGFNKSLISMCLSGIRKSTGGYEWRYIES